MTSRKPTLDYDGTVEISASRTGSRPNLETPTGKSANKTSSEVALPLSWKDYMNCFPILPSFVKSIKNGRPSGAIESQNLYVHALQSSGCVIAEELRATNPRRMNSAGHLIEPVGPRMASTGRTFSVSLEYQGWFEILSQDGRAVRALDSVKKLVHVFPKRCLVRQTIVGFRRLDESGAVATEPTKVVEAGTMLRLVETKTSVLATMTPPRHVSKRRHLLVCTDELQEEIYFELEQRGLFHPVAGANDITGVHDVQSLLTKFRLPVIVRLVGGNLPRGGSTGMFRVVKEKRDARCFAMALDDSAAAIEGKLIHLSPLDRSQTFLPSTSHKKLVDDALSVQLERRCGSLIKEYINSFHLVSTSSKTDGAPSSNARFTKRNVNNESPERRGRNRSIAKPTGMTIETQTIRCKMAAESEEDKLLREIEDIYMSVRGIEYVSPQNLTLATSRGMATGGGVAGSKLQYKGFGKPTNGGLNTVSYAANGQRRNNRTPGERRLVQQSHSFQKNLTGQISNRLTLQRKQPWGSSDELRNMDKSLREKPPTIHHIENNFTAKLLRSSVEQLNNSKIIKQIQNEREMNGEASARMNTNESFDRSFTLHTGGRGHHMISGDQLRRSNRDIAKTLENDYEEINKFQKNKPNPNLTDDVKSVTQQRHQPYQESVGRLFSVGDATNVWASVGGEGKVKTLSRPKSYAGTTAWEDYIVHDIDDINSFAPPVPQKRSDSLVNVNAILSTDGDNQWLTPSAGQEAALQDTDIHARRDCFKPTEESGGSRGAGTKASSTTEKFSGFSRALLKAFRRFGNRSTRTLVVTDDDDDGYRGRGDQEPQHLVVGGRGDQEPQHMVTTEAEDLTEVFNEHSANTSQGHITLKENMPLHSAPTTVTVL